MFSCGKKNKVCISTHKHQPSYFVTDLALPSSLPLLSSLPPSLQPLPNSIRPVYSCTMEGTIICFTGFKNKEELVHTSHAHTSFLSLGCTPYNVEKLISLSSDVRTAYFIFRAYVMYKYTNMSIHVSQCK